MDIDRKAAERIKELEAQLEDAYVVIDLCREEIRDKEELIASLRGQLSILRTDRRYEIA
jgi:bacterioferritin (cytochrome b1)